MALTVEISPSTLDMLNEMALETGMKTIDLLEHAMADFHRAWHLEGLGEEVKALKEYRRKLEGKQAIHSAFADQSACRP